MTMVHVENKDRVMVIIQMPIRFTDIESKFLSRYHSWVERYANERRHLTQFSTHFVHGTSRPRIVPIPAFA